MIENKDNRHRMRLQVHYLLAFILLLHSAFFLVYWLAVGSFRPDVDVFIRDAVGLRLPYTIILMVLTALVGLWSLIRFIRLRLAVRKEVWAPSAMHWIYLAVWVLFIALIYGSFGIILQQNPSQRGVLVHLLNLARLVGDPVLFLFAGYWLRRLIIALRQGMIASDRRKWPWTVGIVVALVAIVALWLVPALFPPNWAYQGNLPTRPALIAHRGASMLAPENTLGAAELAAAHQALGFETDVRISLDGVPFLMHDETLARTTNIAEVFPDRVDDLASSFTLEELKQLNAGLWFIQKDPFETIERGMVSQTQLGINQGQPIPTLEEALATVKANDMVILFDMRTPPEDHPFYDSFFDIVVDTCRQAGLNGDVWFLVEPARVQDVLDEAPQMTRVVGVDGGNFPSPDMLLDQQYEIVNVDTGILARDIRAYRQQGLGVNVYTIDEPWLFSQFWLTGVTSVTTNNVHTFSQLDKPFLNVAYSSYLLFWGLFGIIVAIWLASSHPEREEDQPLTMETPDLMDFAKDGDDTVNPSGTSMMVVTETVEPDLAAEQVEDTSADPLMGEDVEL